MGVTNIGPCECCGTAEEISCTNCEPMPSSILLTIAGIANKSPVFGCTGGNGDCDSCNTANGAYVLDGIDGVVGCFDHAAGSACAYEIDNTGVCVCPPDTGPCDETNNCTGSPTFYDRRLVKQACVGIRYDSLLGGVVVTATIDLGSPELDSWQKVFTGVTECLGTFELGPDDRTTSGDGTICDITTVTLTVAA